MLAEPSSAKDDFKAYDMKKDHYLEINVLILELYMEFPMNDENKSLNLQVCNDIFHLLYQKKMTMLTRLLPMLKKLKTQHLISTYHVKMTTLKHFFKS